MSQEQAANYSWLTTGDAAFTQALQTIHSAQHSLKFEMYIFEDCPIGRRIRDALIAAAQRGARVRVLIDSFGSITLLDSFWVPLRKAGGEMRWFNPLSLKRFGFRDHRKLIVSDERVAIIGGFNVAAAYEGDGISRGWRDLGMEVTGPLAHELASSFDEMFARAEFRHRRFTQWRRQDAKRHLVGDSGELLLSGPGRGRSPVKRALRKDLAYARNVQIIVAYFLPPLRLRRALMRVARRGGRVQLILPGKSDIPSIRLAARSLYARLLRAGVEIYEYQPQILHSKLVIIDDIAYVGSSNLDTRSLNINYELLLRLPISGIVAEARKVFAEDLSRSQQIHRTTWRKSRSFWSRLRERWAYFFYAKLDPYVARRQWQGMRQSPTLPRLSSPSSIRSNKRQSSRTIP